MPQSPDIKAGDAVYPLEGAEYNWIRRIVVYVAPDAKTTPFGVFLAPERHIDSSGQLERWVNYNELREEDRNGNPRRRTTNWRNSDDHSTGSNIYPDF